MLKRTSRVRRVRVRQSAGCQRAARPARQEGGAADCPMWG